MLLQAAQHIFHTPVPDTGRQCQVQPSGSRSAPTCCVLLPNLSAVVSSFVASFANVPMMSVTWHTHSSLPFLPRWGLHFLHSAQATPLASSGIPGPLGSSALNSATLLRNSCARSSSISTACSPSERSFRD